MGRGIIASGNTFGNMMNSFGRCCGEARGNRFKIQILLSWCVKVLSFFE
jgi:hypothetical protein